MRASDKYIPSSAASQIRHECTSHFTKRESVLQKFTSGGCWKHSLLTEKMQKKCKKKKRERKKSEFFSPLPPWTHSRQKVCLLCRPPPPCRPPLLLQSLESRVLPQTAQSKACQVAHCQDHKCRTSYPFFGMGWPSACHLSRTYWSTPKKGTPQILSATPVRFLLPPSFTAWHRCAYSL